jgi:glutamate--cysteine ligase
MLPPAYEPGGIRAMLEGLSGPDWAPIVDGGQLIGLKGQGAEDGASVSLEPGGQFELSGAPLVSLHETRAELDRHLKAVHRVAAPLGLGFTPMGFNPVARREDVPRMPKQRYAIMDRYMQKTGSMGLDMMLRTCTVQVNLDFGSESDMVRKLRVGLLLQPVATALFASSPFLEGKPSGFQSLRANVWTDVDPDRTGIPAVMVEEGFGFERFVDWVLDVPMYFVSRDGVLRDAAGLSFRRFIAGSEPALAGLQATMGDFADHITTAFTDVRLKRFLEMRGADAGSPEMMVAQSALWVGLLYDDSALAAADALVRRHDWRDFLALRAAVPRTGLSTPWGAGTLRDFARDVVAIARDGLLARGIGAAAEGSEAGLLAPVEQVVAGGPTQSEIFLEAFNDVWNGNAARALLDFETR